MAGEPDAWEIITPPTGAWPTPVNINGRPAGRVGDSVSIGGAVQDGSGNVFIGG